MPTTETSEAEAAGPVLADLTCASHGKYRAYRRADQVHSPFLIRDCPRCIDEHQQQLDSQRRSRAEQALRSKKLKEILAVAGIPARFADRSLLDYHATQPGQQVALKICRAYAASWPEQMGKGGSLVMTGKPGTGKTHLACAIANAVMPEHMATVAFGAVSSIIRTIRSTYGKNSERTEGQALADLLKPDLLIIDEIGAQTGSDHELQLLFEIINKRYENLRPMILISNLNADKLETFLGQRAMDRFRDCATVLAFDWDSHRGQARASA